MRANNSRILSLWLAVVLSVWGASSWAQTKPSAEAGANPASAPTSQASAPGKAKAKKSPAWWGSDVTPGWALMSWKERNEHRKKMRAMTNYDDCKAYLAEHHEKMAARAKERGQLTLPDAKRDGCASIKP